MHIEPGYLSAGKIAIANVAVVGVGAKYVKELFYKPALIGKSLLAAVFFSLFMQILHVPVGPSELHFVGAMAIYMTLGFIPTLFGFAVGLLLQGFLFEPTDLMHLSVNTLSLVLPLIAVHLTIGRPLRSGNKNVTFPAVARLDALYYSGVTGMVGFWLFMGEIATPFTAWATFALSYLPVVATEAVITYSAVKLLKKYNDSSVVNKGFAVGDLVVKGGL